MGIPTQRVAAALEAVEAAQASRSADELSAAVLPRLLEAVPADVGGWAYLGGGAPTPNDGATRQPGAPVLRMYPVDALDAGAVAGFERHAPTFPLAVHTRPGGDGAPLRLSDTQTRSDWHASAMYGEVFRGVGGEHIVATSLEGSDGVSACVALVRSGRDFSDADLALLVALRPLLARRVRVLTRRVPTLPALSPRERQVLELVATGLTDVAIARRLGCRPRTVDKHLEHAYRTLGVSNRAAAVSGWFASGRPEVLAGRAPGGRT